MRIFPIRVWAAPYAYTCMGNPYTRWEFPYVYGTAIPAHTRKGRACWIASLELTLIHET